MNLLKSIQEADNSLMNNVSVDYMVNTLRSLQESCESVKEGIVYRPEMVPVVYNEATGKYMMDLVDILRLQEAATDFGKECSIVDAIESVEQILKDGGFDGTIANLAVCCKKEDCGAIGEACKKDPNELTKRQKKVEEYTSILTSLKSSGVKIYMV